VGWRGTKLTLLPTYENPSACPFYLLFAKAYQHSVNKLTWMFFLELGQVIDILVYDNPETVGLIMGRYGVLGKDSGHDDRAVVRQHTEAAREYDCVVGVLSRRLMDTNAVGRRGISRGGQKAKTLGKR
jgi:hypothetical protein